MAQLTLSTVALVALDEKVGALLMLPTRGTGSFLCVELDKASALFVSPLYEHTLTLCRPSAPPSQTTQDALTQLGLSAGDCFHAVAEWSAWGARLETDLSIATATTRMRALLARSLFVQSASEASVVCESINTLFGEKAPVISHRTLATYIARYQRLCAERESARHSALGPFWEWAAERDAGQLDAAVNSLFGYVKKGTRFPDLESIVALLQKWKSPLKRILSHKTLEIPRLLTLHRVTRELQLPALRQCLAFALFDAGTCSAKCHLAACELISRLWQLMDVTLEPTDCHVELAFFEQRLKNDHIFMLLQQLYRRALGRFKPHRTQLRQRLLKHFVLPILCAKAEAMALLRSQSSRSTVEPINIKLLYHVYTTLFSPRGEAESIDGVVFSLPDPPPAPPEDDPLILLAFDMLQFHHLLALCYAAQRWLMQPLERLQSLKPASVLAYMETQPVLVTLERKNAALWRENVLSNLAVSVRLFTTAPPQPATSIFDAADEDDDRYQQFRIVLFDPLALRRGEDLELIQALVYDDLGRSALLRESSTNHFFRQRLKEAFAGELDEETWRHELYFESAHFQQIEKRVQRPQVIVADCHLLAAEDVGNLLKWLACHQERVRRVLFVGSIDILPPCQNGQPFLDLLLAMPGEARQLRAHIFDATARAERFRALLDESWVTRSAQFHDYVEPQKGVMYRLRKPDELLRLLETGEFKQKQFVAVHQLRRSDAYEWEKQRVVVELQSRKQRNRIRLDELDIDALMQHQPASAHQCELFLISQGMMKLLSKNQLNLLFSSLRTLVVVGGEETTPMLAFEKDTRPNLRYTSNSIQS